jgi:hypothetical protein
LPIFREKAYLKLAKGTDRGYRLQGQTKLSFKKIDPFRILSSTRNGLEIELPDWLHGIYPVISVEHLEPAHDDPYERSEPQPGPIEVNGEERYIPVID